MSHAHSHEIPEVKTREVTIKGNVFLINERYSVGHTLSAEEADALNGLLAENLRNNFAAQIDRWLKDDQIHSESELQEKLTAYAGEYQFGVRRTRGQTVVAADPVEKVAYQIASDLVKAALKSKGFVLKAVAKEKIAELTEKLLESRPAIREEAARRHAQASDIGASTLDELGL